MGGFRGGFLIWDGLEKVCGRKMGEKCKNPTFSRQKPVSGTGTKEWYRYQRVVPVPMLHRESGTGTTQTGTGTHWQ